ncbi:Nudix hydrolase 1 [Penicillium oxalicum]|uniref:Nudix hydrolase 1 n=1 Tax=Penicillium oxalicum TaxID=69781 RepID=UPI0020B6C6F7|nr:Nudix hydrolase 1 [Penicillium oxalicum]KAI2788471.1 Nudix hydrolase 1 [Penicillium oxalicum]
MAAPTHPDPRIGVGVFVTNAEGKFVLGKRKGSHGADTWALPGGHLEFGESFETCAEREILEETGLKIRNIHYLTATNTVFVAENKHYVTIFMGATLENEQDQPQVRLI